MKKILAAAAIALVAVTGTASAKPGVRIGTLSCDVEGGIGYIIGSSRSVDCTFTGTKGRVEHYEGSLGKLGLDIGATTTARLIWVVFAPGNIGSGDLEGNYTGASAQATVGAGVGANVLIGGFRKSVNLQPASIQGQAGLNVAAGLASMSLRLAN